MKKNIETKSARLFIIVKPSDKKRLKKKADKEKKSINAVIDEAIQLILTE